MSNNSSTATPTLEPPIYLTLSSINVTTSLFSLVLFYRCGRQEIHRVLRTLLMLLSFFESLFHACIIVAYLPAPLSAEATTVLLTMVRFALTMRNWSVTIISWSRVEVVVRPMSSKLGTTLFTGYRLVLLMSFIALNSLVLSVLMQLVQKNSPENLVRSFVLQRNALPVVENVFFTYQGVLPIVLVITATAITITFLRRQTVFRRSLVQRSSISSCTFRLVNQRQCGAARCQPASQTSNLLVARASTVCNNSVNHRCRRRSKREYQAVKIIVALSVIFAVLEFPTDIFAFLTFKTKEAELAVNILVEFDSLGNFIVYTCTTKLFRTVWRRLCRSEDSLQSDLNCVSAMCRNSSYVSGRQEIVAGTREDPV